MKKTNKKPIVKQIGSKNNFRIVELDFKGPVNTAVHLHDYYEFFIIINGSVHQVLNGQDVLLRQNCLYLIFPEDQHFYYLESGESVKLINIEFSRELFQKINSAYITCSGSRDTIWNSISAYIPDKLANALLTRIYFLYTEETILYNINDNDILIGILYDCLSYLMNNKPDLKQAPYWLLEACEKIKNEDKIPDIKRFIKFSGKSQEHLTRSMKQYFNITPSVYINRIKLSRAAHLLKTTDQSILDIMFLCGFNSVSFFNKTFKKEFGMTPSGFRSVCSNSV